MRNSIRFVVTIMLILAASPAFTQIPEEDIVILKDGKVFRGTVSPRIVWGGTVTLQQSGGKTAALFWEEIAVVKRLPLGIPDSTLLHSLFPQSGHGVASPRVDLQGHDRFQDVLITRGGRTLRGVQLDEGINGSIGFWNNGTCVRVPVDSVARITQIYHDLPDSLIARTYVHDPPEWSAGEQRWLTFFGGLAHVSIGDPRIADLVHRPIKDAALFGVDIGIRIAPHLRWVTSATYSSHSHGDVATADIAGIDHVEVRARLMTLLTGAEARSAGPSLVHVRGFAQAGLLLFDDSEFTASFPLTSTQPSGTVVVPGVSTQTFAFSIGCGVVADRYSLDIRWTLSKPSYTGPMQIRFDSGESWIAERPEPRVLNLFMITAGVTPF